MAAAYITNMWYYPTTGWLVGGGDVSLYTPVVCLRWPRCCWWRQVEKRVLKDADARLIAQQLAACRVLPVSYFDARTCNLFHGGLMALVRIELYCIRVANAFSADGSCAGSASKRAGAGGSARALVWSVVSPAFASAP